jgi:hypothetical protein
VLIRPGRPQDESKLRALDHATWSPRISPGAPPAADAPFFKPRLAPQDVLVAERDGALVGFAAVTAGSPMPTRRRKGPSQRDGHTLNAAVRMGCLSAGVTG